MKLVEDDGADIFEKRVRQELASQERLRSGSADACAARAGVRSEPGNRPLRQESSLVPRRFARRSPRSHSPRLQHDHEKDTRPRASPIARSPVGLASFFRILGVRQAPSIGPRGGQRFREDSSRSGAGPSSARSVPVIAFRRRRTSFCVAFRGSAPALNQTLVDVSCQMAFGSIFVVALTIGPPGSTTVVGRLAV